MKSLEEMREYLENEIAELTKYIGGAAKIGYKSIYANEKLMMFQSILAALAERTEEKGGAVREEK